MKTVLIIRKSYFFLGNIIKLRNIYKCLHLFEVENSISELKGDEHSQLMCIEHIHFTLPSSTFGTN